MASSTLFISLAYLKANSPIQSNVDDDLLKPLIILAQDKYVEPILGSTLYAKIIADVQSGTIAGNYKTLLETHIQPMVVQYTLAEGLTQIHSQITNKGVLNKHSDASAPADNKDVMYLERKALDNGNFYAERMIRFLRANYSMYPELNPSTSDASTIFPQQQAYFSGINVAPRDPNFTIANKNQGYHDTNYTF